MAPKRWRCWALIYSVVLRTEASTAVEPVCDPATLGFESTDAGLADAAVALVKCGVARVAGALNPADIEELFKAWLAFEQTQEADSLVHGSVREGRKQTHLPYVHPFDKFNLLGPKSILDDVLSKALGESYALDLITVVVVPAGARQQAPHRDTPNAGSVAVHVPLHSLNEGFAPLSLCAGTHTWTFELSKELYREALLHNERGETTDASLRRLICGGRRVSAPIRVHIDKTSNAMHLVKTRDGRLGANITTINDLTSEQLGWRIGDEIVEVNGQKIAFSDDWDEFLLNSSGHDLDVRLERTEQGPPPPPRLRIVGAPLAVGDVLLYDSRAWHWGMANAENRTRYAMYVNFKASLDHVGVHPEAIGTTKLKRVNSMFSDRLLRLREHTSEL